MEIKGSLVGFLCISVVACVPIKYDKAKEMSNEIIRDNSLAFFEDFRRIFGFTQDHTTSTTTMPPSTTTRSTYSPRGYQPSPYPPPHPHYYPPVYGPPYPNPVSPYGGSIPSYPSYGYRSSFTTGFKNPPVPHGHPSSNEIPKPNMPLVMSTQVPPVTYVLYQTESPLAYPYRQPVHPHPSSAQLSSSSNKPETYIPNKDQQHSDEEFPETSWTGSATVSPLIPNKIAIPNKSGGTLPQHYPRFQVSKTINPDDCHSEEGLLGECLNAYECGINEGFPSGVCHQGLFGKSLPATTKVCCTFPAHCGYETNRRVSYFKSPSYPQLVSNVSDCPYKIDLLPGVCQVRIDFLEFKMKPIYHGQCDNDNAMEIRAGTSKAFIPMSKLCGTLSTGSEDPLRTDGPHLYVHFETDVSPENIPQIPNKQKIQDSLEIKFLVNDYPSVWNIRVTQIKCDGANLQAPSGCGQFYNSNSGKISSLNFPDGEYMNNANLDVCIARDPTACAIKYDINSMSVGITKGGAIGYGLVCDDYLKFNGEKTSICGVGNGRKMVLPVRGSVGFSFRSDSINMPGVSMCPLFCEVISYHFLG